MKKTIFTVLCMVLLAGAFAQKPRVVAFYNLENLFDTINDPDKRDDDFLPDGPYAWNSFKYYKKLSNLDRVLFDIAVEAGKEFPCVIGVSEIENRLVLEDLVSQPKLSHGKYRIVHYDSPDRRGVDVGFLYRPDVFKLEGSRAVPFRREHFYTRDIVTMWGTIDGEPFYFMVNHWPSRRGGKESSSFLREIGAAQCRELADSVLKANPKTKIMIMGDLNDDATDKSIVEVLGAKGKVKDLRAGDLFNPYIELLKAGYGTLAYGDSWNLFDNIIVSENLMSDKTGWHLEKRAGSKFWGNIFRSNYMIQKEGQYKGYPLRTFIGTNFQNGFSDHFPVYVIMAK